jgi:hypothetical protein
MVTFRRCVRPFSGYFSTIEISESFELTLVLLGCENKIFWIWVEVPVSPPPPAPPASGEEKRV